MSKKIVLLVSIIFVLVTTGIVGWQYYSNKNFPDRLSPVITNPPIPTESPEQNDFTATFEIYTNGTKRIFTEAKYHNLSPDVYIENSNPSLINVKKAGITWDNFFKTLPMSLTKDCLVTGTKQTFCSTETKKLRFFLNGLESLNTLETPIKPNDELRVTYGN